MKRSKFLTSLLKGIPLLIALFVLVFVGLGLRAMNPDKSDSPDTIKGVPTRSTSIDINKKGKTRPLLQIATKAKLLTPY